MSAFVDATLLRFAQDAFVADLLTNGLGLSNILAIAFEAVDVRIRSVALQSVAPRSFKVPAFETIRSRGVDERLIPDVRRVQTQRTLPRFGRLDWIDVAFDAVLAAKVELLVGGLQSVTVQTLEQKLGVITSVADLRAKLLGLYAPSIVDDIFTKLRISRLEDFRRQIRLFVEMIGAAPPPFDPNDPSAARNYTVALRVKIVDGFDMSAALQSAKLCRSILENEAIPDSLDGVERVVPYAFIVVFADAAVTDASIPDHTAAQTKAAVQSLFNAERMFAQFIQ
jgi:hypothetical protein